MRLLHAADLHIGLTRYGRPTARGGNTRVDDFIATLRRIVDSAIENRVDAVLIAGDLFDKRYVGPTELAAIAAETKRLSDAGIKVIIVPGNHDGMSTVGDPSTHSLRWLREAGIPNVHVLLEPGRTSYRTPSGILSITALPYAHKRAFEDILGIEDDDERTLAAGARLEQIIDALRPTDETNECHVFVGHLSTVAGATGSEQTMKSTWDVAVGPHVFAPYGYAALGHLHRQQQVAPNAWYAGSPEYIDFGEEGQTKGWLIVEAFHAAHGHTPPPLVSPVASGARPLQQFEFTDSAAETLRAPVIDGAIVKLRFATPARPRPDVLQRLRAAALAEGASFVTSDWKPPLAASRARVTLAENTQPADLLAAYLDANGIAREPALTAGRDLIDGRAA